MVANDKGGELDSQIRTMTGADAGTQEYMSFYQAGLSKVVEKLPKEEIEQARERAKLWNAKGPPADIQAK